MHDSRTRSSELYEGHMSLWQFRELQQVGPGAIVGPCSDMLKEVTQISRSDCLGLVHQAIAIRATVGALPCTETIKLPP